MRPGLLRTMLRIIHRWGLRERPRTVLHSRVPPESMKSTLSWVDFGRATIAISYILPSQYGSRLLSVAANRTYMSMKSYSAIE